jgi:hypothetical protein
MPSIFTKDANGNEIVRYINPFYQQVNKFVRTELDERSKLYGQRVRGVGDSRPVGVEWSYQKTAWATAKSILHPDIILGTVGSNVMSDSKGNMTLYNAERNVPNKPLLSKVEIMNEGQLGSFLKANISFTVFPKFTSNGFDFGRLEESFFVPGREVELKWGWSVSAANKRACQGKFTGIVYNFNWQFNNDMSVSATVSIISPSGLAIGITGDLANKADETTSIEDPSGKILIGSNLATVIDSDLAALNSGSAAELSEGQVNYYDVESTLNRKLDYFTIGVPIEESSDANRGNKISKSIWYVKLGAVSEFINDLLDQFDDPIKQIFAVQCFGNITQYNQNIVSAYPMEVFFPDQYMGKYGSFQPFGESFNPLTEGQEDGCINIGEILLSTDFVKSTYTRFVKEYSGNSNIQYKNITIFFEELIKRINQASGDAYQFTSILFEPELNNIEGQGLKSILSIEDTNLATLLEVRPYDFNATIFKPLIRNVNISSEPPPAVATAAFVAARGNTKPEQTNVQVSRAKDRDIKTYQYEYDRALEDAALLLFNAGAYGFSESWSEQLRGFLVKMKRSATTSDSHWLFNAIYPVDFSVTLDGIHGFKFGDTLKTNMIPSIYNSDYEMVFTVTKINHVIENKDWQTTLTTKARLTGFAKDAEKSRGSIHVVPGAYAAQPGLTTPRRIEPSQEQ